MKKLINILFMTTLLTCSLPLISYAAQEDISQEYIIDEEGYIVSEQLSDEEISQIEQMPSEQEEREKENQAEASEATKSEIVDGAINFALSKQGCPYSKARRNSGNAFDCSSLVYYSYLSAGIDISNGGSSTAAKIARRYSNNQVSLDEIEAGDLIFYSNSRNGRYRNISHVAMSTGNGMQVEASSGRGVVVHRNSYYDGIVMVCRPIS